ncbi:MAG TPA: TraB/GumN family protein, partial [Lysobacter sp.]|nr:TraB/GumN family protein [Lysobacter sp.]
MFMQIALPLSLLLASLVVSLPAGATSSSGSVASAQNAVALPPIAEIPAMTFAADDLTRDVHSGENAEPEITDIEVVLVRGEYSGPGLWKVSKGANTLWILGTVSPVPKGMEWYSPETEAVLAQAQEIIGAPGFA